LDGEAFAGEQAFVIGHQLRQSLERGGGLENQRFHRWGSCAGECGNRIGGASYQEIRCRSGAFAQACPAINQLPCTGRLMWRAASALRMMVAYVEDIQL